jgi:hypothetical protein
MNVFKGCEAIANIYTAILWADPYSCIRGYLKEALV